MVALGAPLGCSSNSKPAPTEASGGSAGGPSDAGSGADVNDAGSGADVNDAGSGGDVNDAGSGGDVTNAGSGGDAGGGATSSSRPVPLPPVVRGDELCGSAPGGDILGAHVLRFENATGNIVVQIGRVFLSQGVGESALYGLSAFSMSLDGREHCSGDPGDITETSYENTHHNWRDRATATLDDVRYELDLSIYVAEEPGEEPSGGLALSAVDLGTGAVVLERVPLLATGGPSRCSDCWSSLSAIVWEVMASNASTLADEHGEYEPWIEIHNTRGSALDLTGWTLSDDLSDRSRWTFPSVTIPARGYLVVFADGQPEQGELHTNFRLSPAGGAAILTSPRGLTDGGQAFGEQETDRSFGYAVEIENYAWMPHPTPGEANPTFE